MKYTGCLEFNENGNYVLVDKETGNEFDLSRKFDSLFDIDVELNIKQDNEVLFDGFGKLYKENYGGKLLKYNIDNKYCFDDILWNCVGEEVEVEIRTYRER